MEWCYIRHDGDDQATAVPQQQRLGARVQYDMRGDSVATLLAKGPENYYVNSEASSEEVPSTHPNAEVRERSSNTNFD